MKTRLLILALSFGLLPSAFALNTNVNKIRVTHIRFDYTGLPMDKGDGLRIRYDSIDPLKHKGSGLPTAEGWGEWIRTGADKEEGKGPRNEPALWVVKDTVKISVRFDGDKTGTAPGVKAIPKSAATAPARLMETKPRAVTLVAKNMVRPEPEEAWLAESSGDDGPFLLPKEYCLFEFTEQTGKSIAKIEDSWEWYYTDDTGKVKRFDETGVHVVFRVLDTPCVPWYKSPPSQPESDPWVSALDFTIKTAPTQGIEDVPAAIKRITDFIHWEYSLEYDTRKTDSKYNPKMVLMDLTGFMEKGRGEIINCYDCAGALTAMSNLVASRNIASRDRYRYQPKFGYIHPGHLIGVGDCNNPRYMGKSILPFPLVPSYFYFELKWPLPPYEGFATRTPFANHAFVIDDGRVYDACLGPQLGEKDLDGYRQQVIDASDTDPAAKEAKSRRTDDRIIKILVRVH